MKDSSNFTSIILGKFASPSLISESESTNALAWAVCVGMMVPVCVWCVCARSSACVQGRGQSQMSDGASGISHFISFFWDPGLSVAWDPPWLPAH